MIRLGIIGTNWISKSFLKAALGTGKYSFSSIFSRNHQTAQDFCQEMGTAHIYTDFLEFCESKDLDMVYIASPNALHYQQAKALILKNKSVVVEKPAFSNSEELLEILNLAQTHGVLFFEAARHIHEANFKILKEKIAEIGNPIGGYLHYLQYSSRYDAVLEGEEPNIFSLKFSGGALMDLGVYPLYAAIELFGMPQTAKYFARKIQTGVDGIGTIILSYQTFELTILVGKIARSRAMIELYGDKATLIANSVANIDYIAIDSKNGLTKNLAALPEPLSMIEEAQVFADIFLSRDQQRYEELCKLSENVSLLMTALRKDAAIYFPADKR